MAGRLERIPQGRMIGGVCTGLARYLNLDLTLTRLVVGALVLFTGVGPLLYGLAWLAIPQQGRQTSGLDTVVGQARQWNQARPTGTPNTAPRAPRRPTETFDLYRDGH